MVAGRKRCSVCRASLRSPAQRGKIEVGRDAPRLHTAQSFDFALLFKQIPAVLRFDFDLFGDIGFACGQVERRLELPVSYLRAAEHFFGAHLTGERRNSGSAQTGR
jgi:hypothetical protein